MYSEVTTYVAVVLLGAQWVRIPDNLAQRRRGAQVSLLVTKNGCFMENVTCVTCFYFFSVYIYIFVIFFCFDLITDGSFTQDFILKILKKFYN